ncbi:MAG TPA: hypothetical protein VMR28_01605, partial [Candidatus Saccharimonadales bacterium]|nr:hypothetical protein [Candidatus Saccharimonadales bacterium]
MSMNTLRRLIVVVIAVLLTVSVGIEITASDVGAAEAVPAFVPSHEVQPLATDDEVASVSSGCYAPVSGGGEIFVTFRNLPYGSFGQAVVFTTP